MRLLKEDPHAKKVSVLENEVVVDFDGDEMDSVHLLQRLIEQEILVESYYKEKGNLETLFLEVTNDSPQGAPENGGAQHE